MAGFAIHTDPHLAHAGAHAKDSVPDLVARGDSSCSTAVSSAPPSPFYSPAPEPREQLHAASMKTAAPAMFAPTQLNRLRGPAQPARAALDMADAASDAAFTDANTLKARAAVRFALRNSERLDSFAVDRILGYGSNGVVLSGRVVDPALGAQAVGLPVAVKIIYKGANSPTVAPVPSEVAILQTIATGDASHRNLLRAYDAWQDERHHYLVTELFGNDWLSTIFPSDAPPAPEDILSFYNPRLRATHTLRVSPGSSDLWAWGIALKHHNTQRLLQQHPGASEADVAALVPLPDARHVRAIFRQTVAGVHHLHTHGRIVHGDIKEENILVQSM
ncbi:hypothetical protein HK405_001525, partial [Cladochytrium tenue]